MKQQMQDMVPHKKRTIRRIPIDKTKRRQPLTTPQIPTDETSPPEEPPSRPPVSTGGASAQPSRYTAQQTRPRHGRSWWKWGIAGVVVLLLIFLVASIIFDGAKLTVEPRHEDVTIDGQFVAASADVATIDEIPFEILTISDIRSQEVSATGEEEVQTKASGRVTIFNDFNEENQRLIANTRFETPEGLIYRIPESVVVPGQTTNTEGETVPGSIEVEVFADEAGQEYNIDLTDFTIPGFEGDPRFFDFFARSKTPMTGGFDGVQKIVGDEDRAVAREMLQTELETVLLQQIASEVPEGFVTYPELAFLRFRQAPQATADDADTVLIQEEGVVQVPVFNEDVLSAFIAAQTIGTYDGVPVLLDTLAELEVAIVDKALVDTTALETFPVTLRGTGTMVWTFDRERLGLDLAGKSRADADMVLSGYPAIQRAEIVIRPFWKRAFPDEAKDITIVVDVSGEEI